MQIFGSYRVIRNSRSLVFSFRHLAILLTALLGAMACTAQDELSPEPLWLATLTGLDDQAVDMQRYRGRPLIVNFWARWCPPCRAEMPDLIKAKADAAHQSVEVLGIALEDRPGPVADYARQLQINYPVVLAKGQNVSLLQALHNPTAALPYTLAINRQGKITYRKLGLMRAGDIAAAFAAAQQ